MLSLLFFSINYFYKYIKKMKKITAFIKPFKLYEVRKALEDIGVQGMSVTESRGYGRQKGQSELYRGEEYDVSFLPKLRIEIATTNQLYEKIIQVIMQTARTGQIGDGKILVSELEEVYRIRTGEHGIDAVAEFI
jgi:nitrogen regulatory protein PII